MVLQIPEEINGVLAGTTSKSPLVRTLAAYEFFLVEVHRIAFMTYHQSPADIEAGEEPEFVWDNEGMNDIRMAVREFVEEWNSI